MNTDMKDICSISIKALNNCEVGLAEWCIIYHTKLPDISTLSCLLENIEDEYSVVAELLSHQDEMKTIFAEAHIKEILDRINTCRTAISNCQLMIQRIKSFIKD
ncbi:MAG: hypothetical protein MJZ34_02525 [Paludibacteraceae bacterium]|nr:hypothetical protein [Paludibacteraceae bacterium]